MNRSVSTLLEAAAALCTLRFAGRRGCSAHHAEIPLSQSGPIPGKPSVGRLAGRIMAAIGFALTYTVCTIQLCSAKDDEEIVFECKYAAGDMHDHIVADDVGITVTNYRDNKYVRNFTTNQKDGLHTGYYRKNRSEVAWGNSYFYNNKLVQFDSFIDRKTGILKNAGGIDGNLNELARCTESAP